MHELSISTHCHSLGVSYILNQKHPESKVGTIDNHLANDTVTVYTFQKLLIDDIKNNSLWKSYLFD